MFDIEKELKKLPEKPGCYIMKDKKDNIIYVGKAINLKKRVTSYFRKNKKTARIENMVKLIDHFEYIVVENEAEALILECNLIKKNMPKFNVLLKDDKTYPYIKINVKADYPDIYITRRILNDGAKYFGPYANAGFAKETIDFIKSRFKIRMCKNFKYKNRPCLNYHINKCSAPCMGYISKEEYKKQIDGIIQILEGKTGKLKKELELEMEEYSQKLNFEKAKEIRDKIYAIDSIMQSQKVSNISENDIDVIGLARNEEKVVIEVFFVRHSKMIERKHYIYNDLIDEKDEEILLEFIKRFYIGKDILPNKIMIEKEIEEREIIEKILEKQAGRKVQIKSPKKGEKLKLVEMAISNAKTTLENKEKDKLNLLKELKEVLKLEKLPRQIESFDISNISGTNQVAGMCTMVDGIIKPSLNKRFKIKTVYSQDDPRCTKEVVIRRLIHSVDLFKEKKDNFGKLPDVIFADGGITQIRAIKEGVEEVNKKIEEKVEKEKIKNYKNKLNIPVFGMVKDDKHKTKALINDKKEEIKVSRELMNLITTFQENVHNIAIGYHRKLREKEMTKSELDNINGLGEKKKQLLLLEFGSVEEIKKKEVFELTKIKGINKDLAIRILEKLNKK